MHTCTQAEQPANASQPSRPLNVSGGTTAAPGATSAGQPSTQDGFFSPDEQPFATMGTTTHEQVTHQLLAVALYVAVGISHEQDLSRACPVTVVQPHPSSTTAENKHYAYKMITPTHAAHTHTCTSTQCAT